MKFALRADVYTRKWPPRGGWRYRQPETGWAAPAPMSDDYPATVQRIIQHRKANPGHNLPFDRATVESDLQHHTASRILSEAPEAAAEWIIPLDDEAAQKKTQAPANATSASRPAAVAAVAGAVKRLKRDVKGARILAEWVGEGSEPVPQGQATARAQTCAGCEFNVKGHQFESIIAEGIRRIESIRGRVRLATPFDKQIETCAKCGCYLKLKVWMPLAKILADKPPEDLPAHCWIKTEEAEEKQGNMRVAYHGYVFDPTGFGHAARSYIRAFLDAGIRVSVRDNHKGSRAQFEPRLRELPGINWKSEVHIAHGIPTEFADLAAQPVTTVFMTAWETDRIHPSWVPILNKASEVWVPSEFNRRAFASKLRVPVVVIPHPSEPLVKVAPWTHPGVKETDFVFYSIFVWQIRKAPDLMILAYFKAFPEDGDHVLVLKTNPGSTEVAETEVARLRNRTQSKARVVVISETWSTDMVARLHERGHCYVSLHRGEGFNLPLFEAVCSGQQIIATGYSGPMDFLDNTVHYLVPFALVPVRQNYQFYTPDMVWAEPDVGVAAKAMVLAFENTPSNIQERVHKGHHTRLRFSPERITKLCLDRLARL